MTVKVNMGSDKPQLAQSEVKALWIQLLNQYVGQNFTVRFTKKSGEIRYMFATIKEPVKEENGYVTVWDLENEGCRRINLLSIDRFCCNNSFIKS